MALKMSAFCNHNDDREKINVRKSLVVVDYMMPSPCLSGPSSNHSHNLSLSRNPNPNQCRNSNPNPGLSIICTIYLLIKLSFEVL